GMGPRTGDDRERRPGFRRLRARDSWSTRRGRDPPRGQRLVGGGGRWRRKPPDDVLRERRGNRDRRPPSGDGDFPSRPGPGAKGGPTEPRARQLRGVVRGRGARISEGIPIVDFTWSRRFHRGGRRG